MWKRLLLVVTSFFLFLPGLWLLADCLANRPVSRMNYERIHVGRPYGEAEEILGAPSRNDLDERYWLIVQSRVKGMPTIDRDWKLPNGKPVWRFWTNGWNTIAVYVDPGGIVVRKYYLCDIQTWPPGISLKWFPLWKTSLTGTGGLLLVFYLYWTWPKKPRHPLPASAVADQCQALAPLARDHKPLRDGTQ